MAVFETEGTKFVFGLHKKKLFSRAYAEIAIENEFVQYREENKDLDLETLQEWIFCMFRLLAGAYASERALTFEGAGIAIDFYPYTVNGEEASRSERREKDCVMAVRLLMRSSDKKRFLGGVYSLLFHRKDIQKFAVALKEEFDKTFVRFIRGRGEYCFVGVSPLGFKGCNYWYLDPTDTVKAGEYVWVRMGKHNAEQIVYVDSVRYFGKDDAPYEPSRVKRVLRKATKEELDG